MESYTLPESGQLQPSYPALSERIQSSFIDGIFLVILMFIASAVMDRYEPVPDWVRMVVFFGIWGLYEPLCTTLGFTLGNYIKRVRVRQAGNPARRINFLQAFVRYVLKITLGWVSFLTIHSNPGRQAIHDIAAGSVVIRQQSPGF